MSVKESKWYLR